MLRRHQRVTVDEKCPDEECGSSNIQRDKHDADVLECRTCGLKYKKTICEICGSKEAILNVHNKKVACKNCEADK